MRGLLLASVALLLLTACSSRPEPEIVGRSATEGGGLFGDATVQVECQVRNTGATGSITVRAAVDAQNGAWTKLQTSVIGKGETRTFTFDFPEVEYQLFGDNSYEYNCGWKVP